MSMTRTMARHAGAALGMTPKSAHTLTKSAITIGTPALLGLLQGYEGGMPNLGPIPYDLLLGGLALGTRIGTAMSPSFARTIDGSIGEDSVEAVMNGALGWFVGQQMGQVGQSLRKSGGKLTGKPATNRVITSGATTGQNYRRLPPGYGQVPAGTMPQRQYNAHALATAILARG